MKNILIYMIALLFIVPVKADGLQLFGSRKSAEKESSNQQSARNQDDDMTEDFSSAEVTARKNIESVIPVKRIPSGWVFRDELLAPWESNLPAVPVSYTHLTLPTICSV